VAELDEPPLAGAPPGPAPAAASLLPRLARTLVTELSWAVVLVQLLGTMLWSSHELDMAGQTRDFATYYQSWYLIAHLHLLPRNTLQGGYLFIRNDAELILYLIAPLYWLFPDHPLGLLWLQDLAAVGVTATCLATVSEWLPWRLTDPARQQAIAGACRLLVVVLVVANPWVYWSISFDVHMEIFGACFGMLALRAALRERRSTLLWALLTALCGTSSVGFLAGVGLAATAVLLWRRRHLLRPSWRTALSSWRPTLSSWRPALSTCWPLALSIGAVVWLAVIAAANATVGAPVGGYAYLTGQASLSDPDVFIHPAVAAVLLGILEHPATAYHVFAEHGWNLWAAISPGGAIGVLGPGLLLVAPTLLANNLLNTEVFSYPGFQSFCVYGAVALGSVGAIAALLRRRRLWVLGSLLAVATLANAAAWCEDWIRTTGPQWIHLTPPTPGILRVFASLIKPGDEVVASQGFVGLFAGHQQVYSFSGPEILPVRAKYIWFVLSPDEGLETASSSTTLEAIDDATRLPGVETLAANLDGIWVYLWEPPAGASAVSLGEPGDPYPIWMDPGSGGVAVTSGPGTRWGVESDGRAGDLFTADFQLSPGSYLATIDLRSDGPVIPEVWDLGTGRLLASDRQGVRAPHGEVVRLGFTVSAPPPPPPHPDGSGLWRYQPIVGGSGANVEVQLWNPGTSAEAWWAAVAPAPAPGARR